MTKIILKKKALYLYNNGTNKAFFNQGGIFMKYFCNPLNVVYRYQFNKDARRPEVPLCIDREAADPSMICFKGNYYIFPSMSLGCWMSEDMVNWTNHKLPDNLPFYDYAPDVRVMGEYVYFCASSHDHPCSHYRTKDPINGPYEEIPGDFDFWDPNLFVDEDGRVYFYWGCSPLTPIWGVEKDPVTMKNIGEPVGLVYGHSDVNGFERVGDDNSMMPLSDEELEEAISSVLAELAAQGTTKEDLGPMYDIMKGYLSKRPYIEGAWVDKFNGKYYLQYAFAGSQYNTYGDGVYVSDSPLGPYTLAETAPFSYKPGGFMNGAGHGSTMEDLKGNIWHAATMRISVNHTFERRVGIWPTGLDADGELFCNQRYGDWPMAVSGEKQDPWANPEWYLLSYQKTATASSFEEGKGPERIANEDCRTWWRATSSEPGEWVQLDLGEEMDVRAIQINFADDTIDIACPGEIVGTRQARFIDGADHVTRYLLEGSNDGEQYVVIEDKSKADTDLTHDFLVREEGIKVRYLKLTIFETAYHQPACISGLRVFGKGNTEAPSVPTFTVTRLNDLEMEVHIQGENAVGYNVLWGASPEKLYHSWMTFEDVQKVTALVKDRDYYVRVDAFNENGITEGTVVKL